MGACGSAATDVKILFMEIANLFPMPIGIFNYDGAFDKEFLINQPQRANEGNSNSVNKYILNDKKISDLRQFIEKSVHNYLMATYRPKNDVRLKITQSWLNWSKPGQFHPKHSHFNSLVSGCFYVNADKERDRIYFFRDGYQQIKMPPIEWNEYNSESWWFPVGTGQLILFPSSLPHMVKTVDAGDTRVSLAFNTFPIGMIGDENNLTALQLER